MVVVVGSGNSAKETALFRATHDLTKDDGVRRPKFIYAIPCQLSPREEINRKKLDTTLTFAPSPSIEHT
jgi:hypothetical protein